MSSVLTEDIASVGPEEMSCVGKEEMSFVGTELLFQSLVDQCCIFCSSEFVRKMFIDFVLKLLPTEEICFPLPQKRYFCCGHSRDHFCGNRRDVFWWNKAFL